MLGGNNLSLLSSFLLLGRSVHTRAEAVVHSPGESSGHPASLFLLYLFSESIYLEIPIMPAVRRVNSIRDRYFRSLFRRHGFGFQFFPRNYKYRQIVGWWRRVKDDISEARIYTLKFVSDFEDGC